MHSTRIAFRFGTDFDFKTRTSHSVLKLIFLAASNLAQLMQRLSSVVNPIEKTGPPHFLHLAEIIRTSLIIISCVAHYKEKAKCPVLAKQSPQNGPLSAHDAIGK
jgi:hypothetical protein